MHNTLLGVNKPFTVAGDSCSRMESLCLKNEFTYLGILPDMRSVNLAFAGTGSRRRNQRIIFTMTARRLPSAIRLDSVAAIANHRSSPGGQER